MPISTSAPYRGVVASFVMSVARIAAARLRISRKTYAQRAIRYQAGPRSQLRSATGGCAPEKIRRQADGRDSRLNAKEEHVCGGRGIM